MKRLFINAALLLITGMAAAQQPEQLPIDQQVRYGHLDNGLTYYICHNAQPKQRCDFHIAQAVGAVLEEDNQNGLAHFLEHMAFNGTEHFAGKGIIEYFESIGVNFGGNINAYTSIDETVYRLSDVPTIREGILDSALLVLYDWAGGLSLLPEEIDAERGVIREEWRTRNSAYGRMSKEAMARLYPGTQYGKRDVIGDTAVINNFDYEALRSYYRQWYGSDLQAIVVVGDIDVDQMEQKIKALWANVPARSNRGERPIYTVNYSDHPQVVVLSDKEAPSTYMMFEYLHEQLPEPVRGTQMEYVARMMHGLIASMFNRRMQEVIHQPSSALAGVSAHYSELYKLKDGFELSAMPKEGKETEAFQELLTELERLRRYGFTATELDLAKTEMQSDYEKMYNERDNRQNITRAREMIRHFEDGEPMPGIEWEYQFIQQVIGMIDLNSVNALAKSYVHDNPNVTIMGTEKQGINLPSEQLAIEMITHMKDMDVAAPAEEKNNAQLVKKMPKLGRIKSIEHNEALGTTQIRLSNGVRVLFRPTTFKSDEILMSAFSAGGLSLVDQQDLPSAYMATDIMDFMGLGTMSQTQLEKALTGKTISLDLSINAYTELMEGSSTIKDLETLLQLVYLSFTAPRKDEEAYNTFIEMLRSSVVNRGQNPKVAFADSVQLMTANHSDRVVLMNEKTVDQITLPAVWKVYKERFADPSDFTFVFVGNINPDDAATLKLIRRWLGGMKTRKTPESFVDHQVRAPQGIVKNEFARQMTTHTATNRIQYTSYDIPYTLANEVNVDIIGRILSTRYLESIREREGGSYGVGCGAIMGTRPVPCTRLIMQFDTDPLKETRLMEIIHEEVQTIAQNGPLEKDLAKEKECMLKDFQENIEQNGFWSDALYTYLMDGVNYITDYKAAVEAITAESVQQTLQQLMASGNIFEVTMMPQE